MQKSVRSEELQVDKILSVGGTQECVLLPLLGETRNSRLEYFVTVQRILYGMEVNIRNFSSVVAVILVQ